MVNSQEERPEPKPSATDETDKSEKESPPETEPDAYSRYLRDSNVWRQSRGRWRKAARPYAKEKEHTDNLERQLEKSRQTLAEKKEWVDWWLERFNFYEEKVDEPGKHYKSFVVGDTAGGEQQKMKHWLRFFLELGDK